MTLNKSEKAPLLKKPILLLYFHPFFNNLLNPFPPPLRQANKTHSTHLPSTKKTRSKLCILNSFLKNDDPLQTSFLQNHKIFKKKWKYRTPFRKDALVWVYFVQMLDEIWPTSFVRGMLWKLGSLLLKTTFQES